MSEKDLSVTIAASHPAFSQVCAVLGLHLDGGPDIKDGRKNKDKKKDEEEESAGEVDFAELKKVFNAAKRKHGEDFCLDVLQKHGKSPKPELTAGRQLSACDEKTWPKMIKAFAAGPKVGKDKDKDEELDGAAVKEAVKAYAEENSRTDAKKILKKIGVKMSEVEDADNKTLIKIMKAVS